MLKKLPNSTYTTIRFVSFSFVFIVIIGLMSVIVYSWTTAIIVQNATIQNESLSTQEISNKIETLFENAYTNLEIYSDEGINTSLSKYFDIGVIQNKGEKITYIEYSNTKFGFLQTFAQTNNLFNRFYLDTTNNIMYVSYSNSGGYEIGAIDLTGSLISPYIKSSPTYTALISRSGTVLNQNSSAINESFLKSLNLNYSGFIQLKLGNLHREILTHNPLTNTNLGVVELSTPLTSQIVGYTQTYAYYILLLGITLFLTIIIMFSILVDIPLTRILSFFEQYSKGNPQEIKIYSHDTFGILSGYINTLIKKIKSDYARIGRADKVQENFLRLSEHILRTPLTSAKGYLDILRSTNQDKNLNQTIDNIDVSLNKLMQLEENILTISKESSDLANMPTELIDIRGVMQEAYNQMQQQANVKKINFIVDTSLPTAVLVRINTKALMQAITNLLDNAIKFTPEGGSVKLYAQVKDEDVIISVSDTGVGLTKEEISLLFEKFSKIEDSLEFNSDGFGLGLYIIRTIVESNGGQVWVDSIKGNGSIFNIKLPVVKG